MLKMKTVKITYDEYIAIMTMILYESKYYIPEDRVKELYDMFFHACKHDMMGMILLNYR